MKYLLDSVIVIDHFNGIQAASNFITKHRDEVCISIITRTEVLTGFSTKHDCSLAKMLLDKISLINFSVADADKAATLRNEMKLKVPDALQAATAKNNGLRLVTRNTKDFKPDQSFVLIPYTL